MLQKCSTIVVAKIFFEEPTKSHYLIEISNKTNLAHTSVKSHLVLLKKNSIIAESSEKRGKRIFPFYKASLNNIYYKVYKKHDNLLSLEESGLIEELDTKFMPKCIVLFGSYAKGEDIENSDIDLFLECKNGDYELSKFEKQLKRKVQLHFKDDFSKYPTELRNNIINGIILKGYLEAFK